MSSVGEKLATAAHFGPRDGHAWAVAACGAMRGCRAAGPRRRAVGEQARVERRSEQLPDDALQFVGLEDAELRMRDGALPVEDHGKR